MRTTYIVKASEITKNWYVVDATGLTLGRLASEIAKILRGKHKPIFTPHLDTGDFVIVTNASCVAFTGDKLDQKIYKRHSGYVGGLKERTLREMMEKKPEEVIRHAVKGMLPKKALGRKIMTKLKIYAGPEHDHKAQNPQELKLFCN